MSKEFFRIKKRDETTLIWTVREIPYKCQILPQPCPVCKKAGTLVGLPAPILEDQKDGTNVVCLPFFQGCNYGFQIDVPEGVLSCVWEIEE
jgi:hypothetical protein